MVFYVVWFDISSIIFSDTNYFMNALLSLVWWFASGSPAPSPPPPSLSPVRVFGNESYYPNSLSSYTSILGDIWLCVGVSWASSTLAVPLPENPEFISLSSMILGNGNYYTDTLLSVVWWFASGARVPLPAPPSLSLRILGNENYYTKRESSLPTTFWSEST